MPPYNEILSILGMKRKKADFASVDRAIRNGFSFNAYVRLRKDLLVTDADLTSALGINRAQLGGVKGGTTRFGLITSDRMYRIARIFALAIEVLRDKKQAAEWLCEPQFGLGERVPFALLLTEAGALEVEHLLGRIQHGVIS